MIINKTKFYKSMAWKRRRKEILIRDGGKCVQCGGITRLIVHHIAPIPWQDDEVEVDSVNALIDVPLETLCIYCHNQKERAASEDDLMYYFLKGMQDNEQPLLE